MRTVRLTLERFLPTCIAVVVLIFFDITLQIFTVVSQCMSDNELWSMSYLRSTLLQRVAAFHPGRTDYHAIDENREYVCNGLELCYSYNSNGERICAHVNSVDHKLSIFKASIVFMVDIGIDGPAMISNRAIANFIANLISSKYNVCLIDISCYENHADILPNHILTDPLSEVPIVLIAASNKCGDALRLLSSTASEVSCTRARSFGLMVSLLALISPAFSEFHCGSDLRTTSISSRFTPLTLGLGHLKNRGGIYLRAAQIATLFHSSLFSRRGDNKQLIVQSPAEFITCLLSQSKKLLSHQAYADVLSCISHLVFGWDFHSVSSYEKSLLLETLFRSSKSIKHLWSLSLQSSTDKSHIADDKTTVPLLSSYNTTASIQQCKLQAIKEPVIFVRIESNQSYLQRIYHSISFNVRTCIAHLLVEIVGMMVQWFIVPSVYSAIWCAGLVLKPAVAILVHTLNLLLYDLPSSDSVPRSSDHPPGNRKSENSKLDRHHLSVSAIQKSPSSSAETVAKSLIATREHIFLANVDGDNHCSIQNGLSCPITHTVEIVAFLGSEDELSSSFDKIVTNPGNSSFDVIGTTHSSSSNSWRPVVHHGPHLCYDDKKGDDGDRLSSVGNMFSSRLLRTWIRELVEQRKREASTTHHVSRSINDHDKELAGQPQPITSSSWTTSIKNDVREYSDLISDNNNEILAASIATKYNIKEHVIPGYEHLDPLWASSATENIYSPLLKSINSAVLHWEQEKQIFSRKQ